MDINNYLWLSSDLVGTIEYPASYFNEKGINTKETTKIDNPFVEKYTYSALPAFTLSKAQL
jgi:hypothetical protein